MPSVAPTGFTLDSGWFSVLAGVNADVFYGATCYSSLDCILVGKSFLDGVIVVTHDRGSTWSRKSVANYPFTDITSRTLSGETVMIAASSGRIYYSYDSSTWLSASITGALYSVTIGTNGKQCSF